MKPHIVLCAGLLATGLCGCKKQQPVAAKQETGPVSVRVAPVTTRQVQRIVESVGTFYPYDEVQVSAEIEGRVQDISVDLGDGVAAGQVMVRISDEEQRYLVAQNEAQLRMSMERLGLKSEKERVGDVRDTPDVRRAQADLFEAEQRYKRGKSLADQGIGSASDLDQALARYRAAEAAYDQSLNATRNLVQDIERMRAGLDLQRKKLRDATVSAPFAGSVKERLVAKGQYVRPNTPLLTLVKIDPIRLRIEVPERMAPWVRMGQTVDVFVEAFEGRKFQGKIWRISPTVDASKRTFVVEVLIANGKNELKPGSYARARIPTEKSEQIHLLPLKSINYVFGANKAYVVANQVIEAREVKLGDRFDQSVEILDGVRDGESVATTELAKLDSGVKVRVLSSEAPRAATGVATAER